MMEPDDIGAVLERTHELAFYGRDHGMIYIPVRVLDLATLLREFAALRKSYEQRGEALQRITAGGVK